MKEIKAIIQFYKTYATSGLKMTLATVVHVEDSSYRRIGARMLILEDGRWVGGISGGCLEGDALLHAKKVMRKGESKVVTYDTRDRDAHQIGVGLGCEGRIDVFLQPVSESLMEVLEQCLYLRESLVLVTPFQGSRAGDLPFFAGVVEPLGKQSKVVQEGADKVLYETIEPNLHLVIVGDNYDVYPMLSICREMGWEITLVGKQRKLKKEGLEGVGQVVALEEIGGISVDPYTAVLSMAHDYATDLEVLRHFSSEPIGYLGLLGPRKRFERMIGELGWSEESVQSVHNPMGLHLGASTPEEIAVSVVAEVIRVFRGGDGKSLKYKQEPIHKRN
ncbi:MAG: XdhC family protein [Saprospirales bacterium]|nr:XdhC family protein [Saprospirales bacterium]MBK8491808.1 XdhC family protein [Saprospirales bacterium]